MKSVVATMLKILAVITAVVGPVAWLVVGSGSRGDSLAGFTIFVSCLIGALVLCSLAVALDLLERIAVAAEKGAVAEASSAPATAPAP